MPQKIFIYGNRFFKLLKTNHVQLIVPARGATPAITGRFDVNYILGQKLVDGRQQTVVVDYYSRTNTTQLEYTRMDYEQTSFEFSYKKFTIINSCDKLMTYM